jgi:outer membrane protein assembly factor BamB
LASSRAPPGSWTAADTKPPLTIPGRRPSASAGVASGRLFLGGGFGSYDFYALDAVSGHVLWQYQTEDDGPTAAVVHEGRVAFNTESCELEVLSTAGRRLWKKWLGDPLMSMPAMACGRVYQVYPDSRGDRRHYLAAYHLADCLSAEAGEVLWRGALDEPVIFQPAVVGGRVYAATGAAASSLSRPATRATTAGLCGAAARPTTAPSFRSRGGVLAKAT